MQAYVVQSQVYRSCIVLRACLQRRKNTHTLTAVTVSIQLMMCALELIHALVTLRSHVLSQENQSMYGICPTAYTTRDM
jgi:hypothetical protein